jgi:HlyD family secretion protein
VSREQIFRKVALERLSSPEQLDRLMQVTQPKGWIGLAACGLFLLVVTVWGFAGSIPTNVEAQGILIKSGGVFDVFAQGSGPITDIKVVEGDLVKKGDVIGHVDQPDMVAKINNAKASLREQLSQHNDLVSFTKTNVSLEEENDVLNHSKIQDTITFSDQRVKALTEQMNNEEALLERGLITKQQVLTTRQSLFTTRDQLEKARSDLKQLRVNQLSTRNTKDQQIIKSQVALNDGERNLKVLEEQLKLAAEVVSPYDGRVLEVKVRPGDIVNRGASIVSLQLADQQSRGLEAVIYVEAKDGKYVQPGMPVQLSPLSAPREEFGYIVGRVTYVSEFPSTRGGMMKVLANDALVQTLQAGGAPFAVYAELVPNPNAASGYKWSSPKGEALKVNSGTMCFVTVTVRERKPIELVIPYIREKSGI